LKPAQKTFQIKTCWGWFTRMLWKLCNIKHKQKYINNKITHIIRYDNYIILYYIVLSIYYITNCTDSRVMFFCHL
jgi:hypothetical protein